VKRAGSPIRISILILSSLLIVIACAGKSELDAVKGRWVRPDGGYLLEIREVEPDGRLAAGYFNPRPIHVEKAEAFLKEGRCEVFIELRDVNYPGSTYRLVYDPEKDILSGVYFQAVERVEFRVYFEREK